MKKSTLRVYLREWRLLQDNKFNSYIPHIKNILHVLSYKFVIEKELSLDEQKSITLLGKLVDEYE